MFVLIKFENNSAFIKLLRLEEKIRLFEVERRLI